MNATGWILYYNEENDQKYYYNTETQQSLWEEEATQDIADAVAALPTELESPYPKSNQEVTAPKRSPISKQEMKMAFANPLVVKSSKAAFKGIAALESIAKKVENSKVKQINGEANGELGVALSKVVNGTVGSKLLGYLHHEQEASTKKFAMSCLCKAVREGELKTPQDRMMLNTMTLLCEHGLKTPEAQVHRKVRERVYGLSCVRFLRRF